MVGDPTSCGWSRTAGLGRHSKTRGPAGSIVAATSAANVLPASNPCPVQGPDAAASTPPAFPPPPAPPAPASVVGATRSNGSRGRAVHSVVSERQRRISVVAARKVRLGNGSWLRSEAGRLSSG